MRACISSGATPVLIVAAFLASLLSQPASAFYFENYVKWANQAVNGGPSAPNCTLAAVDFLDFVYAIVEERAPTVGTARLTQTCVACSAALDATLAFMPSSDPSVCPLLPDPRTANLTALSLRRFVCFGADGADGVSGGGSGGAGSCVVQVVDALKSVGLLERVRYLDPSLTFSGPILPPLCGALFPPLPVSCCSRSWSYLMAGLTQQSCLPGLSHEYASLPGRCEAVLNRTAPGYCEASWPTDLLPLLAPPPAAVCGPSPPAAAATSVPSWLNGSSCSTAQLLLTQPPGSNCGLWCGLLGEMDRIATGEIPGPDGNGTTNGTTNATPPADPSGGGKKKLQTATIVIVCVFSVLIAILLVALAIFAYTLYQEKQTIKREAYQFDTEIQQAMQEAEGPEAPPPGKEPPPPPPLPPGAPAAARAAPAAAADSSPQTPTASRSVSIPASASAAATAGGIDRTPRYVPGPPPPEAAAAAAAAAAAVAAAAAGGEGAAPATAPRATQPGPPRISSNSGVARALVFGDAVAAVAAVETTSRSSRYESATSLFVDPKSPTGGLTRYSSGAAMGSAGNLVVVAAAASAGAGSMTASVTAVTTAAVMDRLRSHRLSLTDSETAPSVYQTAQGPDSFLAAGGPGGDPSGSYMTVRSTYTAGSVTGGGGAVAAAGREAYTRAQSAGLTTTAAVPSGASQQP